MFEVKVKRPGRPVKKGTLARDYTRIMSLNTYGIRCAMLCLYMCVKIAGLDCVNSGLCTFYIALMPRSICDS